MDPVNRRKFSGAAAPSGRFREVLRENETPIGIRSGFQLLEELMLPHAGEKLHPEIPIGKLMFRKTSLWENLGGMHASEPEAFGSPGPAEPSGSRLWESILSPGLRFPEKKGPT